MEDSLAREHGNEAEAGLQEQPYVYRALKLPDSIRTVMITKVTEDHIECLLTEQSTSGGGYAALSYVWGSEDRPYRAIVQTESGQILGCIALTRNLNSALRDLWASLEVPNKTFWIDQICIDQDGPEKNSQVAMMGSIYRNADRVLVYAGPSDSDAVQRTRGLELLESLCAHFAPNFEMLTRTSDSFFRPIILANLPMQKLPEHIATSATKDDWQWLLGLCFGEFATRLWIVQEQTLNAKMNIVRGHHVYDWDKVMSMVVLWNLFLLPVSLVVQFWHEHMLHIETTPEDVATSITVIWRRRNSRSPPATDMKLPANLNAHSSRLLCRDPRDRIFALLSVCSDTADLGIDVDYSKSPSQVLHQASVALLRLYGRWVDLLTWSSNVDNLADDGIPSWALHKPRPLMLTSNGLNFSQYHAHPNRTARQPLRCVEDDAVLILRGRKVAVIARSTRPWYMNQSFDLMLQDEKNLESKIEVSEMITTVLDLDGVDEENATALFYALQAGPSSVEPEQFSGSEVHYLYCFLREMARPVRGFKALPGRVQQEHKSRLADPLRTISKIGQLLDAAGIDHSSLEESMPAIEVAMSQKLKDCLRFNGRSFCMTDSGELATVANIAEVGDVVVALEGSDRLWALRPTSSKSVEGSMRYKLVGDAWVPGMMHGEAYEGLHPDEVDSEIELI